MTLWRLKFPKISDDHSGCEWIVVYAEVVRGEDVVVSREGTGPLITVGKQEYACTLFREFHERICFALRDGPLRNVRGKVGNLVAFSAE
jgi:hypothetical protein